MRIFMVLWVVAFVPFTFGLDISKEIELIKKQELAVTSLLSEINALSTGKTIEKSRLNKIMKEYQDASDSTTEMIEATIKLTNNASSGVNEVGGDDEDDIEMVYCSAINSLRKMLDLSAKLQTYVPLEQCDTLKKDFDKLKKLLKQKL